MGLVFGSFDWLRSVELRACTSSERVFFLLIFIEAFPSHGGPAGRSARRDLPSLDGLVGYLVSSLELIPSARV